MSALPVVQTRSRLPGPPPRLARGDHEFLPAALEILETPLSPVRGSMIVTICALAAIALVWSYVGQVDIIATAQGKIQPVGRTKTIQPIATGKVAMVAVENGRRVHAGDILLSLDTNEVLADESALQAALSAETAEALRRTTALSLGGEADRRCRPDHRVRERCAAGDQGPRATRARPRHGPTRQHGRQP